MPMEPAQVSPVSWFTCFFIFLMESLILKQIYAIYIILNVSLMTALGQALYTEILGLLDLRRRLRGSSGKTNMFW